MWKSWKLIPVIALATAIAVLAIGVIVAVYSESSYKEQKINEVTVQAQILATTVTAALTFDDRQASQEYVNALKVNPEVLLAGVYDASAKLFAGYARPGVGQLPATVEVREPHFEGEYLVVTVPVKAGSIMIGTVYLQTITEPVARRLTRYIGITLLVTMTVLVVVVLGFAHAALSRANADLAARAEELAATNLQLQAQMEERAKAEEALRQSQKMEAIGQLSGGIAHDFNNLLTIVRGHLQMMRKRIAAGQMDVAHYIDFAMEGLNRAASVTQRILAFSRRQPLSPRPVDLGDLVVEMGELLRHSTGGRIAMDTRLTANWWTLCDPNQMENVLLNLVINARDAMPDGGRLTIETADIHAEGPPPGFDGAPAGDYVLLAVADTGIGMSDEVREKAIDPFFTTKPQGQGTGLGLSMIFGYIKQSQGFLRIESEPGKGTTVSILMPRHGDAVTEQRPAESSVSDAVSPAVATTSPAESGRGPATSILIVEDEFLVRMVAAETLRDAGYNVLEEGDGNAAMAIIGSGAVIDLLVTDVKLPGANGYQLAQFGIEHRPGLKVLLMTGYAQDPIPDELVRMGVHVLYKPYNLDQLAAEVARMVTPASRSGGRPDGPNS